MYFPQLETTVSTYRETMGKIGWSTPSPIEAMIQEGKFYGASRTLRMTSSLVKHQGYREEFFTLKTCKSQNILFLI